MRGLIRNATPKAEPSGQSGCRPTDGPPTPPTFAGQGSASGILQRCGRKPQRCLGASGVIPWMGRRAWDRGGSDDSRLRRTCCKFFSAEAGPPLGLLLFHPAPFPPRRFFLPQDLRRLANAASPFLVPSCLKVSRSPLQHHHELRVRQFDLRVRNLSLPHSQLSARTCSPKGSTLPPR